MSRLELARGLQTSTAVLAAVAVTLGCGQKSADARQAASLDLCLNAMTVGTGLIEVDRAVEIAPEVVGWVDAGVPALVMVDFRTGVTRQVGRAGQGPGEFRHPGPPVRFPDGIIGVPDRPGRLMHLFVNDGSYRRTVRLPPGPFLESVYFADSVGRLYTVLESRPGPQAPGNGDDSAAVVRMDLSGQTTDTVWRIGAPLIGQFPVGNGAVAVMPTPFARTTFFGVSADGTQWRIGSVPPRVDTRSASGDVAVGPVWTDAALPVTDADRDSVIREYRHSRWPDIQLEFARQKPLMSDAAIAPWGQAWVRLTALNRGLAQYRIYDARGIAIDSVTMNPACRIAGFGRDRVFLLWTTEDGFTSLLVAHLPERFRH